MKNLTIVFTRSKKKFAIASKIIMWWMGTDYSHCAREFNIFDFHMYYQASEGRVNYESEHIFNQKHTIICKYTVEINDQDHNAIVKSCLKEVGIRYGFMQNIGIVYVWVVFKLLKKSIDNPWKKGKNCSELILPLLQKIFPNEFSNLNPNTVTPKDLQTRLEDLKQLGSII